MTIDEFALQYCSNLIEQRNATEDILSDDILPYDEIKLTEDGSIEKVVYLDDDGRYINIYDLISYTPEEVEASKDEDLQNAYNAYMSMVDVTDTKIMDITRLAREWASRKETLSGNIS